MTQGTASSRVRDEVMKNPLRSRAEIARAAKCSPALVAKMAMEGYRCRAAAQKARLTEENSRYITLMSIRMNVSPSEWVNSIIDDARIEDEGDD